MITSFASAIIKNLLQIFLGEYVYSFSAKIEENTHHDAGFTLKVRSGASFLEKTLINAPKLINKIYSTFAPQLSDFRNFNVIYQKNQSPKYQTFINKLISFIHEDKVNKNLAVSVKVTYLLHKLDESDNNEKYKLNFNLKVYFLPRYAHKPDILLMEFNLIFVLEDTLDIADLRIEVEEKRVYHEFFYICASLIETFYYRSYTQARSIPYELFKYIFKRPPEDLIKGKIEFEKITYKEYLDLFFKFIKEKEDVVIDLYKDATYIYLVLEVFGDSVFDLLHSKANNDDFEHSDLVLAPFPEVLKIKEKTESKRGFFAYFIKELIRDYLKGKRIE